MNKHKLLYILIFIFVLGFYMIGFSNPSSTISIINNTDTTISNLTIKYSNSNEDCLEIPVLPKGEKYDLKFELPETLTEGCIKICYLDNMKEHKEEYIEGYIEKGYDKDIIVNINSIDTFGILKFDIKNN